MLIWKLIFHNNLLALQFKLMPMSLSLEVDKQPDLQYSPCARSLFPKSNNTDIAAIATANLGMILIILMIGCTHVYSRSQDFCEHKQIHS